MPKQDAVPDAWDDDWESLADKSAPPTSSETPRTGANMSKAERKAKHAESNRQIWESAENPQPMLFLQARESVPLQTTFKPNVTLLSRKPPPQVLARNDVNAGMAGLALDEDDSEEERRKKAEESFAERQARAQKERAEKQRKYAEAREKLFGSPAPSSGDSRGASPSKQTRGKGRGRGGRDSQPRSSNEQSPARPANTGRQLYDPSYSPRPNSIYQQKKDANGTFAETANDVQQPIREPRGPQAIGRGGRGFAPRGNHGTPSAS
ncbi:hypothetical protein K491DRAFT_717616 [Lophiostoma macrostomum CBS 122681]|uniref:SUZ domain-containing protein n=1 Tax=Lophiostoma macrostomum CBS 122681 TaxID=1314788 RepID=A0A6A6T2F8_9PLEO|nr:hypothetical protein K491DRAFT_717616 [Lophiostoma macrostomum CBS 122681]